MCTRVVYSGKNEMVATGRSMDWKTEMERYCFENMFLRTEKNSDGIRL